MAPSLDASSAFHGSIVRTTSSRAAFPAGAGAHVGGLRSARVGPYSGMRRVSAGRRKGAINQDRRCRGLLPAQGRVGRFEGSGVTNWTITCNEIWSAAYPLLTNGQGRQWINQLSI